jgi:hypothetical protein
MQSTVHQEPASFLAVAHHNADGGVISYAGYGEGGDTARIAPVYTPPHFRGRAK